MAKTLVIALGGNALVKQKQAGTIEQQLHNLAETVDHIVDLVRQGHRIVLTHGNGPQVGALLIQQDEAKELVPAMPMDVCVAETQGQIGYMFQSVFTHKLKDLKPIVTVLTQVVVDRKDRAFKNPTKPVGPFYTEKEARALWNKFDMVEDAGRGYRRVVASPKPIKTVEADIIKSLLDDAVVVACGGGGIPIVMQDGELKGVEAVIDKDLASENLAEEIGADMLVILTGVDKVALNFGKPDQRDLDKLSVEQARRHLAKGQFPPGSMGPKIQAAINFIESGGKAVVITSLRLLDKAMARKAGTRITK